MPWLIAIASGLAVAGVGYMFKRSFQGAIDDRIRVMQSAMSRTVGTPNGNGNLMQMTERLLGMQVEQMHWQEQHDHEDERRFRSVHERLDKLEREEEYE